MVTWKRVASVTPVSFWKCHWFSLRNKALALRTKMQGFFPKLPHPAAYTFSTWINMQVLRKKNPLILTLTLRVFSDLAWIFGFTPVTHSRLVWHMIISLGLLSHGRIPNEHADLETRFIRFFTFLLFSFGGPQVLSNSAFGCMTCQCKGRAVLVLEDI